MKSIIALLLAFVMVFALAGCRNHQEESGDYLAVLERRCITYGMNESEQLLPVTVKYESSGGPGDVRLSVYLDEKEQGSARPVLYQAETVHPAESVTFGIPGGRSYRLMAEAMDGNNGTVQLAITTEPEKAVADGEWFDSVLYDRGLEISALLSEMVSNSDYLSALTGSQEIRDVLVGAGAEAPGEPAAVYEIIVPPEALLGLLGIQDTEGMSETLKADLTARSYAAVASKINAMGGVSNLAASSMCTAGRSFVKPGFSGHALYLYIYENAAPVMVSFSEGRDGAVSASGSFILGKAIQTESEEEIREYFAQFGAEVKEIVK